MIRPLMQFLGRHIVEKSFNEIQQYIERLEKENERLANKINTYNKDNEIQRLKKEIDRLHRNSIYILSDKESDLQKQFKQRHRKSCGNVNDFEYRIIGTGFGDAIKIKCPKCMSVEDISDYEW